MSLNVSELHTPYGLARTVNVASYHDNRILMGDETHWGLRSFLSPVQQTDGGSALAVAQVGVEVEDCYGGLHYTNSVLQSDRRFDGNVLVGATDCPVALFSADKDFRLPLAQFDDYHVKGKDNFTSPEQVDALEVTTGQAAYAHQLPELTEEHGDPEFYFLAALLSSPEVLWNLIVEGHDGYQYNVDDIHYIRRVVFDVHSSAPLSDNAAAKFTRISRDTDLNPLIRDLIQPVYEESGICIDPGFHIVTRFSSGHQQPEAKGASVRQLTNSSTNRLWTMKSGVLVAKY